MRDARGRPRAPGCIPGDRGRERRHARRRDPGVRRERRLRDRDARGGRLDGRAATSSTSRSRSRSSSSRRPPPRTRWAASRAAPWDGDRRVTPIDINLILRARTRAGATERSPRPRSGRRSRPIRAASTTSRASSPAGSRWSSGAGAASPSRSRTPRPRRGRGDPLQPGQHARRAAAPSPTSRRAAGGLGLHDDQRPGGRHELRRRRVCSPRPARPRPSPCVNNPQTNVIAELDGREDDNVVMSRGPPGLRRGRSRDQRQRQRLGRTAGAR